MEKQSKQQLDWIAAAQRKLFIHRQIAGRNPLWYNEKNERGKANVFLDGYFIPGFFLCNYSNHHRNICGDICKRYEFERLILR